jgi:hypothetical protein
MGKDKDPDSRTEVGIGAWIFGEEVWTGNEDWIVEVLTFAVNGSITRQLTE